MALSLAPASATSWATELRHVFDSRTRSRALDYIDLVELSEGDGGLYVAKVQGTRREPYEVRIVTGLDDGALGACNCPIGSDLVPCKHLLATLYAIDRHCPDRGVAPVSLDVREIDDDALADIGPPRSIARAARRRGAVTSNERGRDAEIEAGLAVKGSADGRGRADAGRSPVSNALQGRRSAVDWRERVGSYWPRSFPSVDGKRVEIEYIVQATPVAGNASVPAYGFGRDRVQIVAGTVTRGAGGALSRRLGIDRGRYLEETDRELIARLFDTRLLDAYGGTTYVAPTAGSRAVGCELAASRLVEDLPKLAATGRFGWVPGRDLTREPLVPLAWDGDRPWRLAVVMEREGTGRGPVCVRGELVRDEERAPVSAVQAVAAEQVAIMDGRIVRIATAALAQWCELLAGGIRLLADEVGTFLDHTCQHADGPILELGACGWTIAEPALVARTLLSARGAGFDAMTELRYEGEPISGPGVLVIDARKRQIVRRRYADEQRIVAAAKQAGAPVGRPVYVAGAKLRSVVEAATAAGIEVWVAGKRVRTSFDLHARVSSGIDWFDVTIDVGDGDARAELPELLGAIRKEQSFLRLSDGTVVLRPKWVDAHARMLAHAAQPDGETLRFRRAEILALEQMVADAERLDVDAGFRALRDRLDRVGDLAPRAPRHGFRAELRDYQRHGLGWLHFLRETGFGGCLADDMGLGKTVQVLALLDGIRGKSGRPSLVVAPKSLVFHWIDEARRFAPRLTTLEWHGAGRADAAKRLGEVDLVVTTYATLRRDLERFTARAFELVILDEAQAIKNGKSQIAAACRDLRAEHRLALTGTPIENRLDDLASIFDFLNPGLLGRANILRELGAAGGELEEARVLGKLLRPFLLRRTKDEVLTELPPKTEQILSCRLEGKERKQYDDLRRHYRDALLPQVEREGVGRSAIVVLEALLRLRQAALHPGLLDAGRGDEPSAKLDALVEQLQEVTASGHRALVFSQFTSMLAIVQQRLEREGIAFEYLDGQTADRRERVAAFQQGSAPVFLLSLKAGGSGLNLTQADHVFLLDPWWNPAVEAQAIDRIHRIGQARPVTAYRLVAEDTVEAKILALQDHKRALFTNLFEDKGVLARMTAADIKALLD